MSYFFRYKCSNEFLTANRTMTDAVKKCRRVQSQRYWVSQGFLFGQKSSKTVDMSIQLWSRGGLDLKSEENELFLLPESRAGSLEKTEASICLHNTTVPHFASTWLMKVIWLITLLITRLCGWLTWSHAVWPYYSNSNLSRAFLQSVHFRNTGWKCHYVCVLRPQQSGLSQHFHHIL